MAAMTQTERDWDSSILPAHVVRAIDRALDEASILADFESGIDLEDLVIDAVAFQLGEQFAEIDQAALSAAVTQRISAKLAPR